MLDNKKLFKKTDFAHCQTVIVAISGGSDSTALLFLLHDYLQRQKALKTGDKWPKILAVTVDHGLRSNSHDEAKKVANLCQSLGIDHKIACWAEQKPQTAISAQARIARYELLIYEAEKAKASVIMTGHTQNDQVETYKMRLERGGKRGLAVMARESLLMHKIRLIRPLLLVKRQELRDYLQNIGQKWIDDPSNDDISYERVRVRQAIKETEIDVLQEKICMATHLRQEQAERAAKLFQHLDKTMVFGQFLINTAKKNQLDHKDFPFLLANLAALFGGASYFPSHRQVEYIRQFFLKDDKVTFRFNLLGAVIEKNNTTFRIYREARNIKDKIVAPNTVTLWDGRYYVQNLQKYAIRLGAAQLSDIKRQIKIENIDKNLIHFPSLQTSLAIYTHEAVDIPALNGNLLKEKNIRLYRSMQPFGWLVSANDYVFYKALRDFFAKNWQIYQGLDKKAE